ncbi:dienelactone hydrolase family protein [Bacillus sp. UNC438CL73TsuS30]|nr:dienelactone hydrolase family protein [Bacillus sp. UNC438CL73TsuS30]
MKNLIMIYQNTAHAFFNNTRVSYKVDSARDTYQQVLQFFHQVLDTETI